MTLIKQTARVRKVLRDEIINIFAMTYGIPQPSGVRYQFLLCKKKCLPPDPYILYPKSSPPKYVKSEVGKSFSRQIQATNYEPQFITFIDSSIRFTPCIEIFEELYKKDYFSLWEPSEPLKYYGGLPQGYLVIFRTFRLGEKINDNLIKSHPRIKGRNVISELSNEIQVTLSEPIFSDSLFDQYKKEIEEVIKGRSKYHIKPYKLNLIPVEMSSDQEIKIEEERWEKTYTGKSLQDIENEIRWIDKREEREIISRQFMRDPRITIFAKKRANGICDLCGEVSPITRDDGSLYLESHHIIPFEEGGSDNKSNICALCPNCHKKMHFDKDRVEYQSFLIKKYEA